MGIIGDDIIKAKEILDSGGVVAIPTETVYGLAGNATSPKVVASIFDIKQRPSFNPLIVHFNSVNSVLKFGLTITDKLHHLIEKFWPGPLTIVVPSAGKVPGIVTAGLDTVAVRVPNHPLTLELLTKLEYPLAAPSANKFGFTSPTTAQHVKDSLGSKVDYIFDGGPCSVGVESTVVTERNNNITILRNGGISLEQIEQIVGKVGIEISSSKPSSPGQLIQHYSPGKKIILGNIVNNIKLYSNPGILSFKNLVEHVEQSKQRVLSESGNIEEAAANLFRMMRELGGLDIDVILAEKVPEMGLGLAINDRLSRASEDLKIN